FLHEDPRLEVETGRHSEILVRRAREAVDAAVLATAIGIDARFEADVRAVVVGDDRADRIAEIDRPRRAVVAFVILIADVFQRLELVLRIPARTAASDRAHASTAVPVSSPDRRAASASFALSSGKRARSVSILSVFSRSKSAAPSSRVRFATERRTRSPQSSE